MTTRYHTCSTPGCPRLTTRHEPCPEHQRQPGESWDDRDTAAQGRFRAAVMQRANGWCERCAKAPATVAHHIRPGYEPGFGQALCHDCHTEIDNKARRPKAWA